MNQNPLTNFLNVNLKKVCDNLNITHVVKVEEWKNLNSQEIEKLGVTCINLGTNEKKSFNRLYEENVEINMRVRNILIDAIKRKYIDKDSLVMFVFEGTFAAEYSFGVLVVEVSRILYRIAKFRLSEFMENEMVLEKVIEIAEQIKNEGREGKRIGTMFVIGDENELAQYVKPLILNPFHGYPENLRDILSNDLDETIKEYAQLDGAFIVSNSGIVQSAGSYIDINTDNIKRYYGWGTKHTTAAAITQETKSIVVLVSESGSVIKIFKNGRLILKF